MILVFLLWGPTVHLQVLEPDLDCTDASIAIVIFTTLIEILIFKILLDGKFNIQLLFG